MIRRPVVRLTCLMVLMAVAVPAVVPAVVPAQEPKPQDKSYTFSVDVLLVQLPVSVLDKNGDPVPDLGREHFQVFEDGILQQLSLFKHEDIPTSVGLVIDNSASMRYKRQIVNQAALAFAKQSNPDDETFIVNFDDAAFLEQDFTSSIDTLVQALGKMDSRGQTALYDAVYLSADHLNNGKKDKKALLLISDGADNASKYGLDAVLAQLRYTKATVYAIGLLDENSDRRGLFGRRPANKSRELLEKFAAMTGGRAYFPESVYDVEALCRKIAHDIRNHYTLGYTPSNAKLDGSWRAVTVRVNPPKTVSKVTVRAKEGYYAPKGPTIGQRNPQN